jgi:hypothetical protein
MDLSDNCSVTQFKVIAGEHYPTSLDEYLPDFAGQIAWQAGIAARQTYMTMLRSSSQSWMTAGNSRKCPYHLHD